MDNEIKIDSNEIENAVEAILFAAGHPMTYSKLAEVIGTGEGQLKKKVKKFAEKSVDSDIQKKLNKIADVLGKKEIFKNNTISYIGI